METVNVAQKAGGNEGSIVCWLYVRVTRVDE